MIGNLFRERSSRPWTGDELDRLCVGYSLNVNVRQISKDLGRTQEAVRGKAQRLGLTGPRPRGPARPPVRRFSA